MHEGKVIIISHCAGGFEHCGGCSASEDVEHGGLDCLEHWELVFLNFKICNYCKTI